MTKVLQTSSFRACSMTLLLTLTHIVGVTRANVEHTCDYSSRPHPMGYCGSRLPDIIGDLCQALAYNPRFLPKFVKRNSDRVQDVGSKLREIMLNKKQALSYLSKREAPGNILCECCYNHCNTFELMQYCELPSHLYGRRSGRSEPQGIASSPVEDNYS